MLLVLVVVVVRLSDLCTCASDTDQTVGRVVSCRVQVSYRPLASRSLARGYYHRLAQVSCPPPVEGRKPKEYYFQRVEEWLRFGALARGTDARRL
uniref:Putative secreted protein n=1 Tax=Anopheles darlingi TaxID=43151 RepID=A0A2M4DA19_ANODA